MNSNIKKLAVQAGFHLRPHIEGIQDGIDWSSAGYGYDQALVRFAELVRQDEREACAKLCDKASYWDGHVAANCAAAIRGRTE